MPDQRHVYMILSQFRFRIAISDQKLYVKARQGKDLRTAPDLNIERSEYDDMRS